MLIIKTPTYKGPERRLRALWEVVTDDYTGPNRRDDEPISVRHLARLWRVSRRQIREWTRDEPALPAHKLDEYPNATLYFFRWEVRQWAQENGTFVVMPDGRKKFRRTRRRRTSWAH